MPKFILAYHGGEKHMEKEESVALMNKWKTWAEGLGETLCEPGHPLGMSKTVSATEVRDDGGANPLMGYSVIEVDDIDAAVAIAQSCPHLEMKTGTLEIAELMQM